MTITIENTAPAVIVEPKKDNSKRRTTPTPLSKKLEGRIKGYEETIRSADAKVRGGYHKPGSMNRNK